MTTVVLGDVTVDVVVLEVFFFFPDFVFTVVVTVAVDPELVVVVKSSDEMTVIKDF